VKVRYTERAKADLDLAFGWYETQRRRLGFDFLDCVESVILRIAENPELYAKRYLNFRAAMIRRFPFAVYFTIEDSEVIVHSVFDQRQDPAGRPRS
jgi:plasmid stabilization system protein ParE